LFIIASGGQLLKSWANGLGTNNSGELGFWPNCCILRKIDIYGYWLKRQRLKNLFCQTFSKSLAPGRADRGKIKTKKSN